MKWSPQFPINFAPTVPHAMPGGSIFTQYCPDKYLTNKLVRLTSGKPRNSTTCKTCSKGPANATADKLKLLLTRTLESYRYFFRKADVRWLGFLNRHGLLFPRWETADYFARIAAEASEDVMAIIEGMKTDDNDWSTRRGFVDAAIKMPPNVARRLIKKVEAEKWLTGPAADWLSHILSELLAILIADSQHEDALRLAKLMIQGDNGVAYLRDFYFGEVLKNLSAVPAPDLAPYIKLLVQSLGMAIAHDAPNGNDDRSLMWRPAIENNPQNWRHGESKDHLVTALRDAMARHLAHLRSLATLDISAALDALLESEPPYAIFTRVKLHFYRQELAQFMPQIEQVLVDQFDGTNTRNVAHGSRDQCREAGSWMRTSEDMRQYY